MSSLSLQCSAGLNGLGRPLERVEHQRRIGESSLASRGPTRQRDELARQHVPATLSSRWRRLPSFSAAKLRRGTSKPVPRAAPSPRSRGGPRPAADSQPTGPFTHCWNRPDSPWPRDGQRQNSASPDDGEVMSARAGVAAESRTSPRCRCVRANPPGKSYDRTTPHRRKRRAFSGTRSPSWSICWGRTRR